MLNSNIIKVTEPSSAKDFEAYYKLRYEVLRKPWNQPLGSEIDESDSTSIHAFIKLGEEALAVGRLHFIDKDIAQIRYMAVAHSQHGKGLGKQVIEFLENKATDHHRKKVILHARESALKFYEKCGYKVKEKSYLLWGQIQHYLMEKDLNHH